MMIPVIPAPTGQLPGQPGSSSLARAASGIPSHHNLRQRTRGAAAGRKEMMGQLGTSPNICSCVSAQRRNIAKLRVPEFSIE